MHTAALFLLVICFKIHVLNVIVIAKLVFWKLAPNKNVFKKIIEIFNEKQRRLQKTIAGLEGVNQKQFLR